MLAQISSQATSVDASNAGNAGLLKAVSKRLLRAPVGGAGRQVLDDQAGGVNRPGFDVFGIQAGITNMRISQKDDLLAVTLVSQDLLIARHRCVENNLTDSGNRRSDRDPAENSSISQRQDGQTRFGK